MTPQYRTPMKISDRFNLIKKLGQGTFSYIYEAYDKNMKQNVALKIEKKDKNKSILIFEYNVLNMLKGLSHVCSAYDFVKNSEQNLIVMDLLGNNLAKVRKCLEDNYNFKIAVQLLIEMLDSIEEVHDRGFIHRDVKASNFVLSRDNKHVFIVDFGLAKKHLDDNKMPVPQRKKADFRGTVSFASLNAHNNIDLSRRDDIWSLYFVILDFLNEKLKWREQKEYTMDEVKAIKTDCLENPEQKLWIVTKDIQEVKNIFYHLKSLSYKDQPDYEYIRGQLKSILAKNLEIPSNYINSFAQQPGNLPIRVAPNGAPIQQYYLQQHQQQNGPFTVFSTHYNSQKALAIGAPAASQNSNQEFQTPERPQNHHRLIQATSVLHQSQMNTPATPQNNQSLGFNDEGAFPKASSHHLVGTLGANGQLIQGNCNFQNNLAQQFFTTNVQQRKALPNGAQISLELQTQVGQTHITASVQGIQSQPGDSKRTNLKRKNITQVEQAVRHEQLQQEDFSNNQLQGQLIGQSAVTPSNTRRTKQVTKQEKKPTAAVQKKRDAKKVPNVTIIPDEEPVKIQTLIEGAANDLLLSSGGQQKLQQNLTTPNNIPLIQFSPSNANCVNQQISISQNFYLSPHFLLLLNDQNENAGQLFQAATVTPQLQGVQAGFGSTTYAATAATTAALINSRPTSHIAGYQNPEQQILQQGGIPINIQPQAGIMNKVPTQGGFTTMVQTNQDGAAYQFIGNKQKSTQSLVLEENNQDDKNNERQGGFFVQTKLTNINGQNNQVMTQNSYFDIYTQNTIATKHRNAHRKSQTVTNGYCYDPNRIEIQKIPCFKIEKIVRPASQQVEYAPQLLQTNLPLILTSEQQIIEPSPHL